MQASPSVDPEFRDLIPPLLPEELAALEESLSRDGCMMPLVVWGGTLLDGHHRLEICQRLGLPFGTVEVDLPDREAALLWIEQNQLARRNLTDSQRAVIALSVQRRRSEIAMRERGREVANARWGKDRCVSDGVTDTHGPGGVRVESCPAPGQERGVRWLCKCGEVFDVQVWHCPICAHHYAPEDAECGNCHEGRRSKALLAKRMKTDTRAAVAREAKIPERKLRQAALVEKKAPEKLGEVRAGKKTLAQAVREVRRDEHAERVRLAGEAGPPPETESALADVVLADPPWRYDFSETENREVENHYGTASVEEIASHAPETAKDAVLFLWATAPKLKEALLVLEGWGFEYKTCAVWDKELVGMGYWFRGQHELLLVGTKGKPGAPIEELRRSSVFRERRREHSQKPECVYLWIESAFPGKVLLEMYARTRRAGWKAVGNEL